MRYPSPALDGFDALWSDPLRWFARQFFIYGAVAVVTAATVVVGSGIYALLTPRPVAEQIPVPVQKPQLPKPAGVPRKLPETTGALIAGLPSDPIGKPVYVDGHQFGTIDKMIVDANGKVHAFVIQRSEPVGEGEAKTYTVGADAIQWHTANGVGAKGELTFEAVKAQTGQPPR